MLQNRKFVQLLISAVMALVFVNFYLKSKEQSIESGYGMVEVIAAARDIPAHMAINASFLTTKEVPQKFVEPGAFRVKIPGQGFDHVVGKVASATIPAGAQITLPNLADPTVSGTGVEPLIPHGKRGYVLRLGNLDVADLILPGNYIDVMATFSVQENGATTKATYTILQNVLVLAVGRELRKPEQDVSSRKEGSESLTLTLAVDSTEAERLALATSESQGEISVVVRAHGDNEIRPIPVVTPSRLMGVQPKK
ncbi:MAG TPA: Flp pilus assembly protein CpaB [Elusimicrobiota bacterium]|nr:Flp pilus assembly protein CpaB [Elusimicrobiota bacterium]